LILLDSDALIEILQKNSKIGRKLHESLLATAENIGTTTMSLHEVLYGLKKYSQSVKELSQLPVVEFGREDADLSSQIELDMERAGASVRRMDAMIAATAINHSMKLLTLDERHFVPLSKRTRLRLFQ
jgi:predicted nucleic acid-binding protein